MPQAHDPDFSVEAHDTPTLQGGGARFLGPSGEPREAEVCETVFRYQLQQPLVDPPQSPRYYLALRGWDPDEALLCRLRDLTPEVQPLSHCRVTAREGVRDRATGARGVILQVARLAWVHAAAVDVIGGYYLTHRQAASFRYEVEYEVEPDGLRWAVTAAHLLWRV
jgi:hypothetical protein